MTNPGCDADNTRRYNLTEILKLPGAGAWCRRLAKSNLLLPGFCDCGDKPCRWYIDIALEWLATFLDSRR